jgi:S1-C subfamily serine protease
MNNPQPTLMRNRFAVSATVVFAVAIMITIPLNGFVFPSTAVAQQQRINSNTLLSKSTNSSSNPLSLSTIFKQVENSVVQLTSKISTATPNPLNPQTPNVTALGSGFVYDKQGHIITNNHVVGDAKIVDVTFIDGNRYTARVIGSDTYNDIAVLQISQNASKPEHLLSSFRPLVLGNSSKMDVGDAVIAGSPLV